MTLANEVLRYVNSRLQEDVAESEREFLNKVAGLALEIWFIDNQFGSYGRE